MSGGSKKDSANSNENITEKASTPLVTAAPYEIIENNDFSYGGCKRIGIKIIVPDDSKEESVDLTMSNIIDSKKSEWQDITIWAYKDSEKEMGGLLGYTMGIKQYSECT